MQEGDNSGPDIMIPPGGAPTFPGENDELDDPGISRPSERHDEPEEEEPEPSK
jgi:hypothetical protein